MRILHLASFSGNIGDLANHQGFRKMFEEIVYSKPVWTNLEIREFYWKERFFDNELISEINKYDLLVIGGGNYFELWVESSPTGTSLAFPLGLFEKINIPILFNALGVDDGQGASSGALKKFSTFLNILNSNSRIFVSVRNDGSYSTLEKYFSISEISDIYCCPDGGFNSNFDKKRSLDDLQNLKLRIGINLACDMQNLRFSDEFTIADFSREFADLMVNLAAEYPESDFNFFPHIYSDYDIINRVMLNLPDRLRRTRLLISPYGPGIKGAIDVFSDYNICDLVLGMRFHSNVYSISRGIPTIGLENYPQIGKLYRDLDFEKGAIKIQSKKDFRHLFVLCKKYLDESDAFQSQYLTLANRMRFQYLSYGQKLKSWFDTLPIK